MAKQTSNVNVNAAAEPGLAEGEYLYFEPPEQEIKSIFSAQLTLLKQSMGKFQILEREFMNLIDIKAQSAFDIDSD